MKEVTFQEQVHISVDMDGLYMTLALIRRVSFELPKTFLVVSVRCLWCFIVSAMGKAKMELH